MGCVEYRGVPAGETAKRQDLGALSKTSQLGETKPAPFPHLGTALPQPGLGSATGLPCFRLPLPLKKVGVSLCRVREKGVQRLGARPVPMCVCCGWGGVGEGPWAFIGGRGAPTSTPPSIP